MEGSAADRAERSGVIKAMHLGKPTLFVFAALAGAAPVLAGTSDSVRQAVSPDALDSLGATPSSKDKQAFAAIFAAIDGKNWA